ncbi:MAG TPA: arginine repressor [Thermoanaerobaculia bacterium]|jgi:transcriptional regulator of arginine metabolism|nr:arginine repressor [Thermoanaerobaculia bacterium]
MPADREYQRRRQMVIRDILRDEEPVADQAELVERLRQKGISAAQPSISRDLKELGAVRSGGRYYIPSWAERADETPFRRVLPLIRSIRPAGPYQLVVLTMEGAGAAVAAAIDASDWEDLVGTIAGHSSVLLLTEGKFFQDLLIYRLKFFKEEYGIGVQDGEDEP